MTHKRISPEKHSKRGFGILKKAFEMGPFLRWICEVLLDTNLKLPKFVLYTGKTKPQEHICIYKSTIGLVTTDEIVLCKAFSSTFSEKALTWFTSSKMNSIDSWNYLEKIFLDKFSTAKKILKSNGDLTNVKQGDDEPLLDYLETFKKIYDEIEGLGQDIVMTYFEGGLRTHALKIEFGLRHP